MKHFNDMDDIYKDDLIFHEKIIQCSVCEKEYKRKNDRLAKEHIAKRECHSYYQVFKGTNTEEVLYDIYLRLAAALYQQQQIKVRIISHKKFTNSIKYNQAGKFYMFCYNNKIQDIMGYLDYVIDNTYWKFENQIVTNAIKESVLVDHRKDRMKKSNEELDEKFYNQHEDRLSSDIDFLLRSFERADINPEYYFNQVSFDDTMVKMSDIEKSRLEKFLKGMI